MYHGVATTIQVIDNEEIIFKNVPKEVMVGRYHSWAVVKETFPAALKVTAVDAEGVSVGIGNDGHSADRTGKRLHEKFHAGGAHFRHCFVEIPNLKRHHAAVVARLPRRLHIRDRQGLPSDGIFNPDALGIPVHAVVLQSEHALIKGRRAAIQRQYFGVIGSQTQRDIAGASGVGVLWMSQSISPVRTRLVGGATVVIVKAMVDPPTAEQ